MTEQTATDDLTGGKGGEGGGAELAWLENISDQLPEGAAADTLTDRKWIENKGWKSPADVVANYRQLERQMGAGRLAVPKDANDTAAFEAIYKTLGVPEAADGYKVELPEGADDTTVKAFAAVAHQHKLTPTQFEASVKFHDEMVAKATEQMEAQLVARNEEAQGALRGEWGGDYDRNMELAKRGVRMFAEAAGLKLTAGEGEEQQGLDAKLTQLETMLGAMGLYKAFNRLGTMIGEDTFEGGGRQTMGTTPEGAQARLDELKKDKEFTAKLNAGDKAAKAEWDRLNGLAAQAIDAKRAAA